MYTLKFKTDNGFCMMKYHRAEVRDHYAAVLLAQGIWVTLSKVPA